MKRDFTPSRKNRSTISRYSAQSSDPERLSFLQKLRDYEILLLDDFLTTPISSHIASELLNILAAREHRGSTIITSQFDPEDWYRSLHDAEIAESILNRLVSKSEMIQLDGPNMRRYDYDAMPGKTDGQLLGGGDAWITSFSGCFPIHALLLPFRYM
ncbi:ATP-binding protein [Glutamicibacter arilaitensis]|uniref:ATP-binding protein n=1 Tax=Glutamicibacter arilaitensis TaxID=256701 RepID=UPI003F9211F5